MKETKAGDRIIFHNKHGEVPFPGRDGQEAGVLAVFRTRPELTCAQVEFKDGFTLPVWEDECDTLAKATTVAG